MRTLMMFAFAFSAVILLWLTHDRTQIIIIFGIIAYCLNEAIKSIEDI